MTDHELLRLAELERALVEDWRVCRDAYVSLRTNVMFWRSPDTAERWRDIRRAAATLRAAAARIDEIATGRLVESPLPLVEEEGQEWEK
jgi:hypothetical protein